MPLAEIWQKEIRGVKIKPIRDVRSGQSPLCILFITKKLCQKENAGLCISKVEFEFWNKNGQ